MLDLQEAFHTVADEIERAGGTGGLTLQAWRGASDEGRLRVLQPFTTFAIETGVPPEPRTGQLSLRAIHGRALRIPGDYRDLSPDERAYLHDQERCYTGFQWPGREHDRRPAWRPRPDAEERESCLFVHICEAPTIRYQT